MNEEHQGPIIESSHNGNLTTGSGKTVFIVAVILSVVALSIAYIAEQNEMFYQEEYLSEEDYFEEFYAAQEGMEDEEETESDLESTLPADVEEKLAEVEGTTAEFYYNRALTKETEKDFEGAIADYDKAILLAKRYSSEMFNSLNNRGVLKSDQFKNYREAKKDFNKIIEIETNRYDGNANETRLEAGYTNRAYVRKMLGDKQGACDDLYEALALATESSSAYIEKQLEKNCY